MLLVVEGRRAIDEQGTCGRAVANAARADGWQVCAVEPLVDQLGEQRAAAACRQIAGCGALIPGIGSVAVDYVASQHLHIPRHGIGDRIGHDVTQVAQLSSIDGSIGPGTTQHLDHIIAIERTVCNQRCNQVGQRTVLNAVLRSDHDGRSAFDRAAGGCNRGVGSAGRCGEQAR